MSFLQIVRRAKAYLEGQGRVSLSALRREFDLDDDALGDLVEELVEVQNVAVRDARTLRWTGSAGDSPGVELRQLTAMFCDVVGSTSLGEADLKRRFNATRVLISRHSPGLGDVFCGHGGIIRALQFPGSLAPPS